MPGAARHDALLYASDQEFETALVPFIRDGLEEGAAVVAVTTDANVALLQDALGHDADHVEFVDANSWYEHPLSTIDSYRRVVDERLGRGATSVRVIGEVQFGSVDTQQRDWLRYEAALNPIFADVAVWIVCPYDERALPPSVVEHAGNTHPHVWRGSSRSRSAAYTDPWHAARRLLSPLPAQGGVLGEIRVNGDLSEPRKALRQITAAAGLEADRVEELTLAVTEAVTNALVHGVPPVLLRIYKDRSGIICDISDHGPGYVDPLAGFLPPPDASTAEGGRGLWLARQLTDRMDFVPSGGKTVLRLCKSFGNRAGGTACRGTLSRNGS